MKRKGNNPKRRLVPASSLDELKLKALTCKISYVGSGHHKRSPGDYGLERTSPRPTKSLCDLTKAVTLKQARQLLAKGIEAGMVSKLSDGGFPKFIWCMDEDETVYEAKTDTNNLGVYHGYPLEVEDNFRTYVLTEWKKRCR